MPPNHQQNSSAGLQGEDRKGFCDVSISQSHRPQDSQSVAVGAEGQLPREHVPASTWLSPPSRRTEPSFQENAGSLLLGKSTKATGPVGPHTACPNQMRSTLDSFLMRHCGGFRATRCQQSFNTNKSERHPHPHESHSVNISLFPLGELVKYEK